MSKFISLAGFNVWHWYDSAKKITMCGYEINADRFTIIREYPPKDGRICSKCLAEIGREMLTEFMGMNWFNEPTYDKIIEERKRK